MSNLAKDILTGTVDNTKRSPTTEEIITEAEKLNAFVTNTGIAPK